jgi:hypothetical protein
MVDENKLKGSLTSMTPTSALTTVTVTNLPPPWAQRSGEEDSALSDGRTAMDLQQQLSLEEYEQFQLPEEWQKVLTFRNSCAIALEKLPAVFTPRHVAVTSGRAQRTWELVGLDFFNRGRFHEAIAIFSKLYEHILVSQGETQQRVHKGMPLVWISDCYSRLSFPALAKRYLMLTLCEDAIRGNGLVCAEETGVYFRLVWEYGLSDTLLRKYAWKMFELSETNPGDTLYPEWVLQEIDQDWMTEFPSVAEMSTYAANVLYVRSLMQGLGDATGRTLERLAAYLMSCMPGCRTKRRERSGSTDYDLVCSIEGPDVDFRSELGRYFVCECKDWDSPADFSAMAKFCRVLDSVKSRFGILFSKTGITGAGKSKDAEREQLKVFQDRGMVILVVDEGLIDRVANGENFISLLRRQYEMVRLDLTRK